MNLLPSGTWDHLKDRGFKVRKAQEELGFQETTSRIDLTPIHYQYLAIEAFDQGLIIEGRFANFLRVYRLEARCIAEILQEYSSGMTEENMDIDLRQGA